MTMYVIDCGGFQGSSYYKTFDEAQAAANVRTYCTGHKWTVKPVYFPITDD